MLLAYWSSVWFEGEFTPETGTVHRHRLPKPRDASTALLGYFDIERPMFGFRTVLALYQIDGELFFQAGEHRWPLSQPGLEFRFGALTSGLLSRFCVIENGRNTWQISYLHPVRAFIGIIDPTYDTLDFERDHFLYFVASTVLNPEWQKNVKDIWPFSTSAA